MHPIFSHISGFIALSLISLSTGAATQAPLRIAIDPGHGGVDGGAVYGGQREATLVLEYAKLLQEKIKDDSRFEILMTRDNDKSLTLPQRVRLAEEFKADLFMSLHMNASSDPRAKGAQFFLQSHIPVEESRPRKSQNAGELDLILGDIREQSRRFMSLGFIRLLHQDWFKGATPKSNVVRQAPFYVVSRASMPSVLIEIGFLTHAKESKLLSQSAYREQVTTALMESLTNYHDHFKKNSSPIQNP